MICPCGTGKPYANCCQPFHEGNYPNHGLDLMRSRYSAYALKIPDYIMQTTHPDNPLYKEDKVLWKREIIHFSESTTFEKLEILEFITKQDEAHVYFIAHLKQNNHTFLLKEKSLFVKVGLQWLYRFGTVYD